MILAYKKLLFFEDAPIYPLVLSPVQGTAWTMENGVFVLRVDPRMVLEETGYGIYSMKEEYIHALGGYNGSLAEIQIGGKIMEGERGYRSSEASVTRIIGNETVFEMTRPFLFFYSYGFFESVIAEHIMYVASGYAKRMDWNALDKITEVITVSGTIKNQLEKCRRIAAFIGESPQFQEYRNYHKREHDNVLGHWDRIRSLEQMYAPATYTLPDVRPIPYTKFVGKRP